MFAVDRKYTKEIILACVCLAFAAIVIAGLGAASNLVGDMASPDSAPAQSVQTRVVQVGLFNGAKVIVEQTQTLPRPSNGAFGWTVLDWGLFAAAFCMLALAIATFWAVRLFFSPSDW